MSDKKSLLQRYWGYDSFRPLQEEIIDSVAAGHDTLALMPTGGGKSLCYQIPALMAEGLCLVVSPLIALMKDQVQQLNDRGVKASCVVSGMSPAEVSATLVNCLSGTVKLLYVSPERLEQQRFIEHFRRMRVGLIAVDEAHCVSQWGYDFRPPYLRIAAIRQYQPQVPLIALTATATPAVADDIVRLLQMRDVHRFTASFSRPNLHYSVVRTGDKNLRIVQMVKGFEGCGIIYTRSRRLCKVIADQLESAGVGATYYHAGLEGRERDLRQSVWMKGQCRVMVATNAFGMGIDKGDVRFVIHADCPESLEAYYQETGRAGRDGKEAAAILVCSPNERERLEQMVEAEYPPIRYIRNVYRALCNYYKIPVGSGADSRFDFDLEELCRTYNMSVRECYSACRYIEHAGLIALPDRTDAFSTLFIPVGRDELYRFEVNHMRLGGLVQTLLRMYPGIAMAPVPIDERKIAQRYNTDTADVSAMLRQLHEMHVAEYHRRSKNPQIIFTSARIDERSLSLGEQDYDSLKRAARDRMEAMAEYIGDDKSCRMRRMLAYFGQKEGVEDCGVCDVCRRKYGAPDDFKGRVRSLLAGRRLSVQELLVMLAPDDDDTLTDQLRDMMERGELHMDADMRLSLA